MKHRIAVLAAQKFLVGVGLISLVSWMLPRASAQSVATRPTANLVNELRNQDMVFALLTEVYASVQRSSFTADYDSWLQAAQRLPDEPARKRIAQLAETERFLREQQLVRRLERMGIAYDLARRLDEERLGVTIMANVDARALNRHLYELLPIRQREPDTPVFSDGQPMAFEKYLSQLTVSPSPVVVDKPVPPKFLELLTSLRGSSDRLVMAVTEALRQPAAIYTDNSGEPALVIITYRKSGDTIYETVVQSFEQKPETLAVAQNWQAAHPRVSNLPFADTFDKWLTLLGHADGHSYGSPVLIQQRDRLVQSLRQRDLRYLRK